LGFLIRAVPAINCWATVVLTLRDKESRPLIVRTDLESCHFGHAPGWSQALPGPPHSRVAFTTGIVTLDGKRPVRRTRCVSFRKSLSFASKIFRTKVCGFLSIIGNQVL